MIGFLEGGGKAYIVFFFFSFFSMNVLLDIPLSFGIFSLIFFYIFLSHRYHVMTQMSVFGFLFSVIVNSVFVY
jgi:hypothetical protein